MSIDENGNGNGNDMGPAPVETVEERLAEPLNPQRLDLEMQGFRLKPTGQVQMHGAVASRTPTTVQKQYMARLERQFFYLRHYCRLEIERLVHRIILPEDKIEAVQHHAGTRHAFTRNEYLFASTVADSCPTHVIPPEEKDKLVEWLREKASQANRILPTVETGFLSTLHNGVQIETKTGVGQLYDLNRIQEILDLASKSKKNPCLLTIAYLYCLDYQAVIIDDGIRGKATPRFMPFYPTRELNLAVLSIYGGAVTLMRFLESSGLGVDLEKATVEDLESIRLQLKALPSGSE